MMVLWLGLGCSPTPSPPPAAILIVIDRLRADELGAYGDLPTDTPEIDALAGRGTRYTRAYAPSTSVGPSRASLKTSQLPPQHGQREEGEVSSEFGVWTTKAGWEPCEVNIDVSKFEKHNFELNKCVASDAKLLVVWVQGGPSGESTKIDSVVGDVAASWHALHPDSIGALVGLTGRSRGLHSDAELLLTDDLLRVPLVVWGPDQPTNWQIDDVTSTANLGPKLASLAGTKLADVPVPRGVAYHESTVGYTMFGARPLTGFTRTDGRYVEGVYGRWYPVEGEAVRHYEDPQSEYPEAALELAAITREFDVSNGLPPDAWTAGLDPFERRQAANLVDKVRLAQMRGHPEAAERILQRLEAEFPGSPILTSLRAEMKAQAD